jgi:ATP-dependent helicase HrpA
LARESAPAEAAGRFRWLVEEYRVSLFAQNLGTAEPVSPVKLDRELAALRRAADPPGGGDTPRPSGTPLPLSPSPRRAGQRGSDGGSKAAGAVKSLGALDRLFPRD